METKVIRAKERQTGSYGTVNAGDTVTVLADTAQELIANGCFEEAEEANPTATPEQVVEHNASGLEQDPIHADGTDREILNDEGRELHNSGPEALAESSARAEAEIAPDVSVPASDDAATPADAAKKTKKP